MDDDRHPLNLPAPSERERRRQRLAEELKRNLARRKAQGRARRPDEADPFGTGEGRDPPP